MFLTEDEKRMRDGAEGDAVAAAMDLLIRYGFALEADRLCDIRNVAGTMTQPSPVKARLVAEGGWDKAFAVINLDSDLDLTIPSMRVPTCQLQHGFGPDSVDIVPYPPENVALQEDAESFYGRHGVNILATCTPYQVGNLPLRGEHCAWMESSAVIYANSVLGARTNCEGIASTGAASLTGKVPCWGNHLDANRHGTHLVDVRGLTVESFQDWGMLGYFAGGVAGEDHPVIIGDIARPDLTELKHFGAAAATSGGVELYHIPGITPEAPTVEAAFSGAAQVPEAVVYGPAERRAMYETLNEIGSSDDVDFVLLGCPHASVDQIRRTAELLDGRRLSSGTELWIMAPRSLKVVADRSGYTAVIERAGGRVLADSCPAMSRAAPAGHPGVRDRLGQAGALPARDPRHRGLVRHPRRVRRRGRHRALERGAELMSGAAHPARADGRPRRRRGRGPGVARADLRLGRHRPGPRRDHRAPARAVRGLLHRQDPRLPERQGVLRLVRLLPDDAAVRHRADRHGHRPDLGQVGPRGGGDPGPGRDRPRRRPVRGHRHRRLAAPRQLDSGGNQAMTAERQGRGP